MSSHTDTTTTSYINENGIRCAKPVRLKLCEFQDCEKEGKHKACGWNLCLEHVLEVFGVGGKSGKKRVKEIFNQEIQKAREERDEEIIGIYKTLITQGYPVSVAQLQIALNKHE